MLVFGDTCIGGGDRGRVAAPPQPRPDERLDPASSYLRRRVGRADPPKWIETARGRVRSTRGVSESPGVRLRALSCPEAPLTFSSAAESGADPFRGKDGRFRSVSDAPEVPTLSSGTTTLLDAKQRRCPVVLLLDVGRNEVRC